MFKDKVLLITGGTGSFGNRVLKRFLNSDIGEIRIFSRDEKKQDDMRRKYANDKIKFYIGDVRDLASVNNVMDGVNFVFQAAALKQVPSCEFFPIEAVKTNILGTDNVVNSAINHGVEKVICLSTDKAAYPINAMGMSKALMEKAAIARARTESTKTTICVTRYGNVMGSRGSVIPLFYKLIEEKAPLTITNPNMTRFMMTLDDAVELVLFAFKNGRTGDLFVQKAPAATIETLAEAVCKFKGVPVNTKIIGTRHGEKQAETLVTREEMMRAEDLGNYFRIGMDDRDLNYGKYFEKGNKNIEEITEYTSDNTERLDVDGMMKLLIKMGEIEG
ncbi:MAG: polysaccharide biosynthesis protein [Candidatus Methanofastidiosum sp.]|nr:polysaccharide biosynthesis protein [Methanofastidiosum sp.]